METAIRILIVGGTSVLFFGLLMGIPMVMARKKASRPPRYLFAAHLVPIIQGGLLLALTIPVEFSALSAMMATVTAVCLLGGMVFFIGGLFLNWLQGVEDAFAENAPGGLVSAIGTPFVLAGGALLLYGVLTAALG